MTDHVGAYVVTDGTHLYAFYYDECDDGGMVEEPAFRAHYCRFFYYYDVPAGVLILDEKMFDFGNNYDTTTGKFTAPFDGVYLFGFETVMYIDGASSSWFGSITINSDQDIISTTMTQNDAGTSHNPVNISGLMFLRAGDQAWVESSHDLSDSNLQSPEFWGYLVRKITVSDSYAIGSCGGGEPE